MNIKSPRAVIKVLSNKKYKGSVTVEAALSFTLTIFILFMMLGPLFIIRTTSDLLVKMNEASKSRCNYEMIKRSIESTAIYEKIKTYIDGAGIHSVDLEKIEDAVNFISVLVGYNNLYDENEREYRNINFVYDKTNSNYNEDTGIVKYDYVFDFNMPYNILHVKNPTSRLVVTRRAFIGADGDRFDASTNPSDYIYLADNYYNSHIYHSYINCTYLIKSTFTYDYSEVINQKNVDNQRYTKCTYCFRNIDIKDDTTCYVTEYGDRFHYKDNCPLMTAYVTKVTKDYIDRYELTLCSRCARREGEDD